MSLENKTQLFCENPLCGTTNTPLWRKGWKKTDTNGTAKKVRLCNACGLHYRKGHFCPYCYEIYKPNFEIECESQLHCCDVCSRWVHKKCVEKAGVVVNHENKYKCQDCIETEKVKKTTPVPLKEPLSIKIPIQIRTNSLKELPPVQKTIQKNPLKKITIKELPIQIQAPLAKKIQTLPPPPEVEVCNEYKVVKRSCEDCVNYNGQELPSIHCVILNKCNISSQ